MLKQLLLSAAYRQGAYWVFNGRTQSPGEMLRNPADHAWVVVKEASARVFENRVDRQQGFKLKVGDLIKLGRVRFRVKELNGDKFNVVQHHNTTKAILSLTKNSFSSEYGFFDNQLVVNGVPRTLYEDAEVGPAGITPDLGEARAEALRLRS